MEPYSWEKGKLIVREMTELLVLDLVRKGLVTKQVVLTIGYDRTSLTKVEDGFFRIAKTGKPYQVKVTKDHYGRSQPKHAHGTGNLDRWTSSTKRIMAAMMELYDRVVDPDLLVRRINVVAANLIPEGEIPAELPEQLSLFVDQAEADRRKASEKEADAKEKRLQQATLRLQSKYGKNAVLKGMNLEKGATTIQRNRQIGGHRSGEE